MTSYEETVLLMSKSPLRRFLKRARIQMLALLGCGLLLIAFGLFSWLFSARPESHRLRATGGIVGLNRHQMVQYLQKHAKQDGLEIEIQPTKGTIEATRKVALQEIDLAVVNALLRSPKADSIRQIAPITVEAVHLLVKRELLDQVLEDLGTLERLRINVGPEGSETFLLSNSLLRFCGIRLDDPEVLTRLELDRREIDELITAMSRLEDNPSEVAELRAELPDVIVHTSVLPSPFARQMIQSGQYGLVPLPFAEAFSRITVEEEEQDQDHLDQVHVVQTTIPQYLYGVSPPEPARDVLTLGCPLILIGHDAVAQDAVMKLLPWIYTGPVARVYQPPALDQVVPTYPWHSAAVQYRDRDQPLLRSDLVQAAQLVISIVAPLIGGCLALYGFYRWRQTLRFIQYFEQFQAIDLEAKGLLEDDRVTPTEAEVARRLEAQLTRLQQNAVTDFCRNYFHGEGVLENFLQLLAETRDYLRLSSRISERLETQSNPRPILESSEPMTGEDTESPSGGDSRTSGVV